MWLLDANMDAHLLSLLREFGVEGEAAPAGDKASALKVLKETEGVLILP